MDVKESIYKLLYYDSLRLKTLIYFQKCISRSHFRALLWKRDICWDQGKLVTFLELVEFRLVSGRIVGPELVVRSSLCPALAGSLLYVQYFAILFVCRFGFEFLSRFEWDIWRDLSFNWQRNGGESSVGGCSQRKPRFVSTFPLDFCSIAVWYGRLPPCTLHFRPANKARVICQESSPPPLRNAPASLSSTANSINLTGGK